MSGGGKANGAIADNQMPKWHEGKQPQPGVTYTRSFGADGFDNTSFQPQPAFPINQGVNNAPNRDGNPLTNNKHTTQKQDFEEIYKQTQKAKQTAGLSDAARKEIGAHNIFPSPERFTRNSGPTGMSPVYEMPSVRTPRDFMSNISTSRRGK